MLNESSSIFSSHNNIKV